MTEKYKEWHEIKRGNTVKERANYEYVIDLLYEIDPDEKDFFIEDEKRVFIRPGSEAWDELSYWLSKKAGNMLFEEVLALTIDSALEKKWMKEGFNEFRQAVRAAGIPVDEELLGNDCADWWLDFWLQNTKDGFDGEDVIFDFSQVEGLRYEILKHAEFMAEER